MNSDLIKTFYNQHPFPGRYTKEQIVNYDVTLNPYINLLDQYIDHGQQVLDIGSGTGLITHVMANRYSSEFTGIDFSIGAEMAGEYAIRNKISNVKFICTDFFNFSPKSQFDVVIAQSFLTHVPDYQRAVNKIDQLLKPGGIVLVSVYNPYGKLAKKLFKIDYKNQRLRLDQELNPFEQTFTNKQFLSLWPRYKKLTAMPGGNFINLFNYKNGGLTLYALEKPNELD